MEWETAPLLLCVSIKNRWRKCTYHDIIGVFDESENFRFHGQDDTRTQVD